MAMNLYAIIILTALVLEFVLQLVGNLLNLKALKLEVPTALAGIYDTDDYRKSQLYIRIRTRFSLIVSGFSLLLLLTFWFAGGFNWFDQARC